MGIMMMLKCDDDFFDEDHQWCCGDDDEDSDLSVNHLVEDRIFIRITSALCSYPLVKVEIGDSSQISTTAAIFSQ